MGILSRITNAFNDKDKLTILLERYEREKKQIIKNNGGENFGFITIKKELIKEIYDIQNSDSSIEFLNRIRDLEYTCREVDIAVADKLTEFKKESPKPVSKDRIDVLAMIAQEKKILNIDDINVLIDSSDVSKENIDIDRIKCLLADTDNVAFENTCNYLAILSESSPVQVNMLIPSLITDIFSMKARIASGASFAIQKIAERNPDILIPYIDKLVNFLSFSDTYSHYDINAKRSVIHVLGIVGVKKPDAVMQVIARYQNDKDEYVRKNAIKGLENIRLNAAPGTISADNARPQNKSISSSITCKKCNRTYLKDTNIEFYCILDGSYICQDCKAGESRSQNYRITGNTKYNKAGIARRSENLEYMTVLYDFHLYFKNKTAQIVLNASHGTNIQDELDRVFIPNMDNIARRFGYARSDVILDYLDMST